MSLTWNKYKKAPFERWGQSDSTRRTRGIYMMTEFDRNTILAEIDVVEKNIAAGLDFLKKIVKILSGEKEQK
jgi:hypothetical protein